MNQRQRTFFYPSSFVTFLLLATALPARAQQTAKKVRVYFATGRTELTDGGKRHLDSMLYEEVLNTTDRYDVIGYASEPGGNVLNDSLSRQRAARVADYLTTEGFIPAGNIRTVTGKGSSEAAGAGESQQFRRVDVVIQESVAGIAAVPPKPVTINRIAELDSNGVIPLNNVYFYDASARFLPGSGQVLDTLVSVLRANPRLKIRLEGHVCCSGDFLISSMRARAVYEYLRSRNISAERLSFARYGGSRPRVWPEKGEEDRKHNRRVEVRITSK